MDALTTPARIRNRIDVKEADISDDVLNEFIEDEQAFIEGYAKKTFLVSDSQFGIARSVCTDRCAVKALMRLLNIPAAGLIYSIDELKIDKSDPASNRLLMLRDIYNHTNDQLILLRPQKYHILRPKSSTF